MMRHTGAPNKDYILCIYPAYKKTSQMQNLTRKWQWQRLGKFQSLRHCRKKTPCKMPPIKFNPASNYKISKHSSRVTRIWSRCSYYTKLRMSICIVGIPLGTTQFGVLQGPGRNLPRGWFGDRDHTARPHPVAIPTQNTLLTYHKQSKEMKIAQEKLFSNSTFPFVFHV
jgi:hypothetical protein